VTTTFQENISLVPNYPNTKPLLVKDNVTPNIKDLLINKINTTLLPLIKSEKTKTKLNKISKLTDPFPPLSPYMKISYLINLESINTEPDPTTEDMLSKSSDGESKPVPLIG